MAKNSARIKSLNEAVRIVGLLLMFLSVSRGLNEVETQVSSSQHKNINKDINILISESVKNPRTLVQNEKILTESTTDAILTTDFLTNSSYIEKLAGEEKSTTERLPKNCQETKQLVDEQNLENSKTRNYYEVIKPTKTFSMGRVKISQTEIGSGEDEGVSMMESRPQKINLTNYKRIKRGFDEAETEKSKAKKKLLEKTNHGKNYNQIEETLRKIAKVTINEEKEVPVSPTITPVNFRESREEENRKASPDIQDIITGIVNILNGKATKHSENTGRPRPTSTRINNRGPPRISDVPPLDFEGPPAYRPLPPPPPKRIPPPYPFDMPPSVPNIPLPPQPPKPASNLPPHPFIDGVPIPKIVIPDENLKKTTTARTPQSEYDTISMSLPVDSQLPPIITVNTTERLSPLVKNTITANEPKTPENNFSILTKNQTSTANNTKNKSDHKVKIQKVEPGNKATNKRVRPSPVSRPSEKGQNKTTNATNEEKTNTSLQTVPPIGGNLTEVTKVEQNGDKPPKEENKKADGSESPFKGSANVSTVLNIKPVREELPRNKTITSDVLNATVYETSTTKENFSEKMEIEMELPVLLEPTLGIGEATPVLESSILELSVPLAEQTKTTTPPISTQRPKPIAPETTQTYKARPGIVLDDPEYKPGGHKRPVITARPIITAPPPQGHFGEIFDVTVHAVQGPGEESSSGKPFINPVNVPGVQPQNPQIIKGDVSVITKPEVGQNFVSIDGKRTYINLFGEASTMKIAPTTSQPQITGTGYAVPHKEVPSHQPSPNLPPISTAPPRRPYKRPSHPPVRIDTCIVGDDTTCDSAQNESCRTEDGVSSCHCRPGYNRRKHRDTCRRVVSMLTSLRVDRLYDRKVKWQDNLQDPDSEEYQQLSYEASQAIESAMSMTPFSDDFINSRINSIYNGKNLENNEPAVYVNVTIQLEENLDTVRPSVKHDIQRHLLRVIQRRNNNVGNSAVWVDSPPGSVLALQDVDECSSSELHDCHESAICTNIFGNFKCQCPSGSRDPWVGNIHREGRFCETCSADYCNNRGECSFEHGQQVCHCSGNFYGTQCEIDGEVLGVAIGASVAAAIIIILTLICLCMWSRRWSREQKTAVGMGSPVFGYMATGPTVKTPSVGSPPYQVSIEDRIRWAQIADVMAKSNHYAQPEPVTKTPRTSFGGYPTLTSHTMSVAGTLPLPTITPPVPLPRLTLANKQPMGTFGAHSQLGSIHQSNHGIRSSLETSSSEEDADRADLLGRNFNVPRPKSRTSVANQSGIYYDVDFDRSDAYSKQNTIPMSTYTLSPHHQVRPYFR